MAGRWGDELTGAGAERLDGTGRRVGFDAAAGGASTWICSVPMEISTVVSEMLGRAGSAEAGLLEGAGAKGEIGWEAGAAMVVAGEEDEVGSGADFAATEAARAGSDAGAEAATAVELRAGGVTFAGFCATQRRTC